MHLLQVDHFQSSKFGDPHLIYEVTSLKNQYFNSSWGVLSEAVKDPSWSFQGVTSLTVQSVVILISNLRFYKYINLASSICLLLISIVYTILQNKLKSSSKLILHFLFSMMLANVSTLVSKWQNDHGVLNRLDGTNLALKICSFLGK